MSDNGTKHNKWREAKDSAWTNSKAKNKFLFLFLGIAVACSIFFVMN